MFTLAQFHNFFDNLGNFSLSVRDASELVLEKPSVVQNNHSFLKWLGRGIKCDVRECVVRTSDSLENPTF